MTFLGTGLMPPDYLLVFVAGVLITALALVALLPVVHNRAVRLTTVRLDAATPAAILELDAERNRLRAEFAAATRRLEHGMETLRVKTGSLLGELNHKGQTIERLTAELQQRAERIAALEQREQALEAREADLFGQVRASKGEIASAREAIETAAAQRDAAQAERDGAVEAVDERQRVIDRQHVEIIALQNQLDALRDQIWHLADGLTQQQPPRRRDGFGLPVSRPSSRHAAGAGPTNGHGAPIRTGVNGGAPGNGKDHSTTNGAGRPGNGTAPV